MVMKCFGCKKTLNIRIIKREANWLPSRKVLLKQLLLSVKAYITLPLFKEKKNGTRSFFYKNYYIQKDPYVFDGNLESYYYQIKNVYSFNKIGQSNVIDLGCGKASLFYWLIKNKKSPKSYVGVDFAIKPRQIEDNAKCVCCNLLEFNDFIGEDNTIFFLTNVLCYLDDNEFRKILSKIQKGSEIVIIDPSPNLFWDVHFDGVRPYYRPVEKVLKILKIEKYKTIEVSKDYMIEKFGSFYFGISYCIYAIRT